MPKEQVTSTRVLPGGGHEPGFCVKVGWERDTAVQLGVETIGERSLVWQLLCGDETTADRGERLQWLGAMIREVVDANRAADHPHANTEAAQIAVDLLNRLDVTTGFSGVWADLGRHDCNSLIRTVRRARDQAYGADE